MGNWFKDLFCGCKCHCHDEKGECCGKKECCEDAPKGDASAEVKPTSDSSASEAKM